MLKSMTGYGSAEGAVGGRRLFVEMKAVNHRYFSFQAKIPSNLSMLEGKVQALLKERLSRGQVSVFANWDKRGGGPPPVRINMDAARQAAELLRAMKNELALAGEIDLSCVLSIPDVTSPPDPNIGDEENQVLAMAVFSEALTGMEKFRAREGVDLDADLKERLEAFRAHAAAVEKMRPRIVADQKLRLEKRIAELVGERASDETLSERLAVEIALFADRCDISEEIVRLRSHAEKFMELLEESGPVGRKLDFLLQEFNRETNTIGSKTADAETSRLIVEMKSELEKMREQVQNVE